MKCPECDGEVIIETVPFYYKNRTLIGEFEAKVCKRCGATYFKKDSLIEIEKRAKILKIWGRQINRKIPNIVDFTVTSKDNLNVISPDLLYKPDSLGYVQITTASRG